MTTNTRIIEFCKILFGFTDSCLLSKNIDVIDDRWGDSPNNIIHFIEGYFMIEIHKNLLKNISLDMWRKHIGEPYVNRYIDGETNNISEHNSNIKIQFIGVTGKKFNGKDTISDYICQKYDFKKLAYATPLKDACRVLFDFNEEQLYGTLKETIDGKWNITPRLVYQYIGTDLFRNQLNKLLPKIGDNFWIKCLEEMVKKYIMINPNVKIIVSDIRFQNEVDSLKKMIVDYKIIRVKRPYINSNDTHDSEKFIDELKYIDYEIENGDTLEMLYNKVDSLFCL